MHMQWVLTGKSPVLVPLIKKMLTLAKKKHKKSFRQYCKRICTAQVRSKICANHC